MDVSLILSGISLSKSIAAYFGMIDSIDAKLDRLSATALDSGLRTLEQAMHSTSESTSLLRSSRSRFNDAILLEKGKRLIIAHLGLSMCHKYLDTRKVFARTAESHGLERSGTAVFLTKLKRLLRREYLSFLVEGFRSSVILTRNAMISSDATSDTSRLPNCFWKTAKKYR